MGIDVRNSVTQGNYHVKRNLGHERSFEPMEKTNE
jgi:hypothetical protein